MDCNKSNLNGSIPANVLKDTCDTFILYLKEIINNPVDTRTKNVRTKDVHKRTFIFGSIWKWKHGETSQSERLINVPMWYV